MRKKMARLEEESNQRSAISVDRDDAVLALQVCSSTLTLLSGLSEDHSRYQNSEKKSQNMENLDWMVSKETT